MLLILITVLAAINPSHESINDINYDLINNKYLSESWSRLLISYQNYFKYQSSNNSLSVFNLNKLDQLIKGSNTSKSCAASLRRLVIESNQFEYWAIAMINSWGKFPPSGIFQGTFTDLGNYDQCVEIQIPDDNTSGQYCLVDFKPKLPPLKFTQTMFKSVNKSLIFKSIYNSNNLANSSGADYIIKNSHFTYFEAIKIGFCIPSNCSQKEIKSIVKLMSNEWGVESSNLFCNTKNKREINYVQDFALSVLISFLLSIIVATIKDLRTKKACIVNQSIFVKSFSLRQNINELLDFKTKSHSNLKCLHGIKVFTLQWVILCHTVQWLDYKLFNRMFQLKTLFTTFLLYPIANGSFSLDTFFVISGMLTTYITWNLTLGKRKNFSIIGYIVMRYCRLTPQIMLYILLTFLLPLINDGPLWNQVVNTAVNKCYVNWWANILYIQNYYDFHNICAIHTWFLATEYQLHLLSLIIILALFRNSKFAYFITTILIIINSLICAWIVYSYNLGPGILNTQRHKEYDMTSPGNIIWKPYIHAAPFFIGIILGYLIKTKKFSQINKVKKYTLWFISLFTLVIICYDTYPWSYGPEYGPWESVILFISSRTIWSIAVAWIIWACVTSNGGTINRFLSWEPFIPLSKLTYSVYLTHGWSLWMFTGSSRAVVDASVYSFLTLFFGNLLWSYVLGAFFYVIIEGPMMSLQRQFVLYLGFINNKV